MPKMKRIVAAVLTVGLVFSLLFFPGCGLNKVTLRIISGSENETLEPLIQDYARANHIDIEMHYKGSLDIMSMLKTGEILNYDAVWPANGIWISLGDEHRYVKYTESIMTSPVVFGIKKSKAEALGFVGKDVYVSDILNAVKSGQLSFIMTSATQSNSGATAYLGFLHALSGEAETLNMTDLSNDMLKADIISLLSGVERSSGSSGWLKDLFLNGDYEAMVNYEALVIETNQELVSQGEEPLYIVYPYDGLGFADSPLGYVDNGDDRKEEAFLGLQTFLLSDETQSKLLIQGRRTAFGGMDNAPKTVFNPEWGIDTDRVLSSIRMPASDVILEALHLYQTEFKKPSYTVYCLDYSGSMASSGEDELKRAMKLILTPEIASTYMLEPSEKDQVAVILFSDEVFGGWIESGSASESLLESINAFQAGGGTDMYLALMTAVQHLNEADLDGYFPAIVLMTDGKSETYNRNQFLQYYNDMIVDIPIFSITFGNADQDQLEDLADLSHALVFDGKDDLVGAFKKARGYN